MPFHSLVQIAKFKELEKKGKIPKGTTEQWLSETPSPGSLPHRSKGGRPKSKR